MWNWAKTGLEEEDFTKLFLCFTGNPELLTAIMATTATGLEKTHADTEMEQPTERCSEPAMEFVEVNLLARTNAGTWYAHRDGLEPNVEAIDAQETGLDSSKMLDREIHAQKDGLGANKDDTDEARERRLESSKMLVREIDDAQEDESKSSMILVGETVGQEDRPKSSNGLVEAQERGLEPNG